MVSPPQGTRPSRRTFYWRRVVVGIGLAAVICGVVVIAISVATGGRNAQTGAGAGGSALSTPAPSQAVDGQSPPTSAVLPGMPPILNPSNVYAADTPGGLSPAVAGDIPMVYVPNGLSNTVTEIDPRTFQVVRTFPVGALPQHVVPSWDLKTLWVTDDDGNNLIPIDPRTGLPGAAVPVADPYNMYFTPDGRFAIVVAEALQRLDFRDPHSMALEHALKVPCPGVDHMDFSADGTYLIASCEFGSTLIKVDVASQRVVGRVQLPNRGQPQDVKLAPDGKLFFIADMISNGVWELDGQTMKVLGFIPTGKGAHGLYISRDFRYLYVTNRDEGSISLIDLQTGRPAAKWQLPGGGSPDMGNVSADGRVLWLSGRYNSEVYAIDTTTGRLLARIPVGAGPHGVCVWPQPGRYSLGHTGILR
jgi:YVTN family beta-propeller protein